MSTRDGRRARAIGLTGLLAVALAITGCGGGEEVRSDDGLYQRGLEVNTTFKQAVAEVQQQLTSDAWRVNSYGNGPQRCDGGFDFDLVRTSPEGFEYGGDPMAAAQQLGDWLGTHGWTDVRVETFGGEVTDVVLQGRRADSYVDRLDVNFRTGSVAEGVVLSATSTCEPGDAHALMAEMYPGWPTDTIEHEPLPSVEAPGDQPVFGFTEDGTPRR